MLRWCRAFRVPSLARGALSLHGGGTVNVIPRNSFHKTAARLCLDRKEKQEKFEEIITADKLYITRKLAKAEGERAWLYNDQFSKTSLKRFTAWLIGASASQQMSIFNSHFLYKILKDHVKKYNRLFCKRM